MRCIISESKNPYFNLATEEYLLKTNDEEIFIIYINEPCVVVGKHQNLLSEINLRYALEHNIKLARRISGGGTVYQDLNNLNFGFIHNCTNLEQINFTKFTNPIREALCEMGLDVLFSGRNDLLIDSKKISGNAMHIFKTRVLSHGTLLFNTDLNQLSAVLKNQPQKYIDRSIKSVRSKVTNISSYLESPKTIEEFKQILFQIITDQYTNPTIIPITNQESSLINQISKSKFETWEWIYGYSPKYTFQNSLSVLNQTVKVEIQVEKGIIKQVKTNISFPQTTQFQYIFDTLLNVRHNKEFISDLLGNDPKINSIPDFNIPEFCLSLF